MIYDVNELLKPRADRIKCFFEPYSINIIKWGRKSAAYCDNTMRIDERDYMQLDAGENGYRIGTYMFCKGGIISNLSVGDYVKAGDFIFLQEEVPNFYV